jgi:hypothetical protein
VLFILSAIFYTIIKAAEAKNKAVFGEEPTEVPMKPIVGCEFFCVKTIKQIGWVMDTK